MPARLHERLAAHLGVWWLAGDFPVDIRTLYASFDHCPSVQTGPVDPALLAQIEASGYDEVPVTESLSDEEREMMSYGFPLGVVDVSSLRALFESGHTLADSAPFIKDVTIPLVPSLRQILDTFSNARSALVVEDPKPPASSGFARMLRGFIRLADLNRHGFRALLYRILADLEAGLAQLVEARLPGGVWIDDISDEDERKRIRDYWDGAKRAKVDAGATAGATLTHLLTVIAKRGLWKELGFTAKSRFEKTTGSFPKLRNDVMHPVRPLVSRGEDVRQLARRLDRIFSLSLRLAGLGMMVMPRTGEGQLAAQLALALKRKTDRG